tara:strand:+ start:78 stop:545 length:468 start_codon:yes stop_codon:yes gene_type:complete
MINNLISENIDSDINLFIEDIKSKYGINIHVVLGGGVANKKQTYLISLETLLDEAYSAMCIYNPHLENITSLKQKTRKQEVVQWAHSFSHIAWHYGYSKTAISLALDKNHATVIHSVKSVTNFLSIKDPMTTNIHNLLMNHYKDNVGNFSGNSKR